MNRGYEALTIFHKHKKNVNCSTVQRRFLHRKRDYDFDTKVAATASSVSFRWGRTAHNLSFMINAEMKKKESEKICKVQAHYHKINT